jgi:hypothetical protein
MASTVIVRNPAILGGEPVSRGTRVPFRALTDYLEHERSLSEFLEDFPSVTENKPSLLWRKPESTRPLRFNESALSRMDSAKIETRANTVRCSGRVISFLGGGKNNL